MAEKLHKWQADFALKDELTQGDFEALEMALFKMPQAATLFRKADLSIVRGAYLRAAIQAGWIVAPKNKSMVDEKDALYIYDGQDVNDMHPAKVNWLGARIVERHDAIMGADPKN